MRLDFNVLWVDDQPNSVAAQIEAIKTQMGEEGFQFNVRPCVSVAEVSGAIGDDVYKDEVDLVLVDWDLGGGREGQDLIAEIREVVSFKDIVFYSALKSTQELREYVFKKELEGIYCARRESLVDEVIGVFKSLVKKVLDIDHTRGIVMGATSDIDHMVNDCLSVIYSVADEPSQEQLLAEAKRFIEEDLESLKALNQKMQAAKHFDDFHEAHKNFTANDRLRVLARALKTKEMNAHKQYRGSVTNYLDNVIPKRNTLGHMMRVKKDGVYVLVSKKGEVYDLESTRELRRLILELRGQFMELRSGLDAAFPKK